MSVKQRLKDYLKSKDISATEFGRAIGVSSAYISSMVQSIPPDKLQRITLNYPDLNTGWLLTGEGEMLKENQPTDDNVPENLYFEDTNPNKGAATSNTKAMEKNLLELLRGQQSQMDRVLSQQEDLISIIKNLTSLSVHNMDAGVESEKKPRPGVLGQGQRGELGTKK